MPSTSRRAVLGAIGTAGIAGCAGWSTDESANTDPADRRVSLTYEPEPDEWIRPTRTLSNVAFASDATPPRASPDERWTVGTADAVSTVAVANGVVYAGTREGVEALSLDDGDRLWEGPEGWNVTVIDGRCYAQSTDRIVAIDATSGDVLWDHTLERRRRTADLLEIDGTVYFTDDEGLHGLHSDTGEVRWTIENEGQGYTTLGVADGSLYWLTRERYRVLEPDGGNRPAERASVLFGGLRTLPAPSSPALAHGMTYAGGWGSGTRGEPGAVRALNEHGIGWHRPFEPWTTTPTPVDDRLVVAGYDNAASAMEESRIAALDPETGAPEWETTVPEPVGVPAVANDAIFVGGAHPAEPSVQVENGGLFAIDIHSGELLWERATDGAFAGHPVALVEDALVLGTRAGIVVLE